MRKRTFTARCALGCASCCHLNLSEKRQPKSLGNYKEVRSQVTRSWNERVYHSINTINLIESGVDPFMAKASDGVTSVRTAAGTTTWTRAH